MFRQRGAFLTDCDKTKTINQHTKLVIVSSSLNYCIKTFNYINLTEVILQSHICVTPRYEPVYRVNRSIYLQYSQNKYDPKN